MPYIAVGQLFGGDVEDILQFCQTIGHVSKPWHAVLLETELMKMIELWPVYLRPEQIYGMLHRTYDKACRHHLKSRSRGPLPNQIQYLWSKGLRYRPHNLSTIITLDMGRTPALLSVQGFFPDMVERYTRRAQIGPVVEVETNKVLFPSEMLDLQLSLGTVLQLLGK